jgi:hypothetical protein
MWLQIHQNRSVGLSFAPSPIIYAENLEGVGGIREGGRRWKFHTLQYRVIPGADSEVGQETGTR